MHRDRRLFNRRRESGYPMPLFARRVCRGGVLHIEVAEAVRVDAFRIVEA